MVQIKICAYFYIYMQNLVKIGRPAAELLHIFHFPAKLVKSSPTNQFPSTECRRYHIPWTCSPQAHLGSVRTCHLGSACLNQAKPPVSTMMPESHNFTHLRASFLHSCAPVLKSKCVVICCLITVFLFISMSYFYNLFITIYSS